MLFQLTRGTIAAWPGLVRMRLTCDRVFVALGVAIGALQILGLVPDSLVQVTCPLTPSTSRPFALRLESCSPRVAFIAGSLHEAFPDIVTTEWPPKFIFDIP